VATFFPTQLNSAELNSRLLLWRNRKNTKLGPQATGRTIGHSFSAVLTSLASLAASKQPSLGSFSNFLCPKRPQDEPAIHLGGGEIGNQVSEKLGPVWRKDCHWNAAHTSRRSPLAPPKPKLPRPARAPRPPARPRWTSGGLPSAPQLARRHFRAAGRKRADLLQREALLVERLGRKECVRLGSQTQKAG